MECGSENSPAGRWARSKSSKDSKVRPSDGRISNSEASSHSRACDRARPPAGERRNSIYL
eukprot:8908712-Pyramimonas_sp.AAC.1